MNLEKYYERLNRELFEKHLISAFILLINLGKNLSFSYNNISYTIINKKNKKILSSIELCMEKMFEDAIDLVDYLIVENKTLVEVWNEIIIYKN